MKRILCATSFMLCAITTNAQMDLPPAGFNPRAMVSEEVGITTIAIKYSRPGVKGREEKIWNGVVATGFGAFNFLTYQPNSPWRAGANEATTMSFEHDVHVEGKALPAGTYALFMALDTDSALLIFSKQAYAWGSFYYKESDDVLRVKVKRVSLPTNVEWLKYEFVDHKQNSCVVAMQWEKVSIPFTITVDVDKIVLARMREELTGVKGFLSANNLQASMYLFNKNTNMEEAMGWARRAVTGIPFAQSGFEGYTNLAFGHERLNQHSAADSVMNEGLRIANLQQFLTYNRTLIAKKRGERAIEVMLKAKERFGNIYSVNEALAYAYSSKGDYSKAQAFARKALLQAPTEGAKLNLTKNIQQLQQKKDIN